MSVGETLTLRFKVSGPKSERNFSAFEVDPKTTIGELKTKFFAEYYNVKSYKLRLFHCGRY